MVAVKPAQVLKVSGAQTTMAVTSVYAWDFGTRRPGAPFGAPSIVPGVGVSTLVPTADLELVDGRLETFAATMPFDLVFKDGRKRKFEYPLEATLEGENLVIASHNWPRTAYPLDSIAHAEFAKVEVGKTLALAFGVPLAVLVASAFVVRAATH